MNIVKASMSAAPPGDTPRASNLAFMSLNPSSLKSSSRAFASSFTFWARSYPTLWITQVSSSEDIILRSVFCRRQSVSAGMPSGHGRVHSRFAAAEYGRGSQCPRLDQTPRRPDVDNDEEKGPGSRINVADTSGLNLPVATIRIACGKGTYIRAFARDLGEALGSGAHLCSLRRTKSGGFVAETALSVSQALELLST